MDPFTAVGLANGIVTFIDFSARLVRTAGEIRHSAGGLADSEETLQKTTRHLKRLMETLVANNTLSTESAFQNLKELNDDCQDLADELLDVLQDIQAKDPSSKRQTVKAALKRYWKSQHVDDLAKRLELLSAALDREIQAIHHGVFQKQLQWIKASEGQLHHDMVMMQNKMESMCSSLREVSLNNDFVMHLTEMLHSSLTAISQARHESILKAIRFDGMDWRFDSVESAHGETFQWLMEKHAELPMTSDRPDSPIWVDRVLIAAKEKARKDLTHWLQDDHSIIHFLGKPGSGKSTMMRFMYDHSETRHQLQIWAGDRTLIMSHFFFWKPGTELQKSIEGLMRSLLHSVLKQQPVLVPLILESYFSVSSSKPFVMGRREIENAFRMLLSSPTIARDYCFVFFIDGLDECEMRGVRETYFSLAAELSSWTTIQPKTIKLCVSSREFPEFESALAQELRIRMQDVTFDDIQHLIDDFFASSQPILRLGLSSEHLRQMKQELTSHSEGVFLWTTLVLRNIERGLRNGDDFIDLSSRLLSLPTELEDMLLGLLDMVESQHKEYCILMLCTVAALTQHNNLDNHLANLYTLWFYEGKFFGPVSSHQNVLKTSPLDAEEKVTRLCSVLQDFEKRIKWRCLGLLGVKNTSFPATHIYYTQIVPSLLGYDKHIPGYGKPVLGYDKHFPLQVWDNVKSDECTRIMDKTVVLPHRSVCDLLSSKHFERLEVPELQNPEIFRTFCSSFLTYAEAAVLGRVPLQISNIIYDASPGLCWSRNLAQLLEFGWSACDRGMEIDSLCKFISDLEDIASKDRVWLCGNGIQGPEWYTDFDAEVCVANTLLYEYFEHQYQHRSSALRGRSLHLLQAATNPRLAVYFPHSEPLDRVLRTTRTLLDHGLDVASPSLIEQTIPDEILSRLCTNAIFEDTDSPNMEHLRDVMEALVCKGAQPTCWAVMSNVDSTVADECIWWDFDDWYERSFRRRRVCFSIPEESRMNHGVPCLLRETSNCRRRTTVDKSFATMDGIRGTLSLGTKYLLTDLLDRARVDISSAVLQKLSVTENRLRALLEGYVVSGAQRTDEDVEEGVFKLEMYTLVPLEQIPQEIRNRTDGRFRMALGGRIVHEIFQ